MAKEKGKEKKKGKKKKTKQKEKEKEVKIEEDEPQEAVAEPEQLSKVHTLFNRYCQNGNRITRIIINKFNHAHISFDLQNLVSG